MGALDDLLNETSSGGTGPGANPPQPYTPYSTSSGGARTYAPSGAARPPTAYQTYLATPRPAYGEHSTRDIANRTIELPDKSASGQTQRVDPYSGQRYSQGTDGSWREAGIMRRDEVQAAVQTNGLPAGAQPGVKSIGESVAASANPSLKSGIGQAGVSGTLQPTQAPRLSSFADYDLPGLGFPANNPDGTPAYKTMSTPSSLNQLTPDNRTILGAPSQRGSVNDLSHGEIKGQGNIHWFPGFNDAKPAPADINLGRTNFSVPTGYEAGPSGFSKTGPDGSYFSPVAMPFNIVAPTLPESGSTSAPTILPGQKLDDNGAVIQPQTITVPGTPGTPAVAGKPGVGTGANNPDYSGGKLSSNAAGGYLRDHLSTGTTAPAPSAAYLKGFQDTIKNNVAKGATTPAIPGKPAIPGTAPTTMQVPGVAPPMTPNAPFDVSQLGRAGAMMLNGPHTVNVNGGGTPSTGLGTGTSVGMGFNPSTILQGYGRASSGDAATDAIMAARLMDRQNQMIKDGQSPLEAFKALNTADPSIYGAPVGAYGNAGNPGAYTEDGSGRGGDFNFATGGKVEALPMGDSGMTPAPVANREATTNLTPGGYAQPATPQSEAPPADGGDPDLAPYQEELRHQAYLTQLRSNDSSRWNAGHVKPTAIEDVNAAPTPGSPALPPGMFLDPTKAIGSAVGQIQGLKQNLTELGDPGDPASLLAQQNKLQADQARYQDAAGVQTKLTGLGDVGDVNALQTRINAMQADEARYKQAQALQTRIQGYGDPGDPSGLETQHNALLQQISPLENIQKLQQELAGLGNQRDVNTILGEKSSLEAGIKMIQDDIANAGQTGVPSRFSGLEIPQMQAQLAALNSEYSKSQGAADRTAEINNILKSQGVTGDVSGQLGQLNAQKAALEQKIANTNSSAADRQAAINQLKGLVPEGTDINAALAALQGEMTPAQQQLANAQQGGALRTQYQNQLKGLMPEGGDINSALAGVQSQLAPLGSKITNANKKVDVSAALANVLKQGVPGRKFKDGGAVTAGAADLPMGGHSMVTPEQIIGIGAFSGKHYFTLGEVNPEKATKTSKDTLKIKPIPGAKYNDDPLPMGGVKKAA